MKINKLLILHLHIDRNELFGSMLLNTTNPSQPRKQINGINNIIRCLYSSDMFITRNWTVSLITVTEHSKQNCFGKRIAFSIYIKIFTYFVDCLPPELQFYQCFPHRNVPFRLWLTAENPPTDRQADTDMKMFLQHLTWYLNLTRVFILLFFFVLQTIE